MDRIDLHTHSTYSDGTFTPAELICYAKEKEIRAIALTDHDTVRGLPEASLAAHEIGIEFINGVELATQTNSIRGKDIEIHIVGLFIDEKCEKLQSNLSAMETSRENRNDKILNRLQAAGLAITHADLLNHTKNNIITRAHFARAIIDKGYCATFAEAFGKYLSPGSGAYVKRETFGLAQTIDMIHNASGLAILAHPLLYKLDYAQVETLAAHLQRNGLDGIESLYSMNTLADDIFLAKLAKKYRLKISGGSDFHGKNKKHIDLGVGQGDLFVPYSVLMALQNI